MLPKEAGNELTLNEKINPNFSIMAFKIQAVVQNR